MSRRRNRDWAEITGKLRGKMGTLAGNGASLMRAAVNQPLPETRLPLCLHPDVLDRLAARNRLVEQWRFLPSFVVSKLWHRIKRLSFQDAEQVGFLALIRAAETYSERRAAEISAERKESGGEFSNPAKFNTYATRAIINRILLHDRQDRTIQIPEYVLANKVAPSILRRDKAGIRRRQFIPLDQRKEMARRVLGVVRLPDDFDRAEARPAPDPFAAEALTDALASLTEQEAAVIRGRFWDGKTLRQIGQELGLTRERIRQVEAEALARLGVALEVREREAERKARQASARAGVV